MEGKMPVRALQVLNHMDYGGIEAVVMNYYRHIDRSKTQFDFAVSEDSLLPQKEEIRKMGGRIYLLPKISCLPAYISTLKKIIQDHDYKIVHCHMNTLSVFPLFAAFLAGVKVRVCHNHTTAYRGEGIKTFAKYFLRPYCKFLATEYFACGEYAGRWMYGNKCFDSGKVYVMKNGIDMSRFKPDPKTRKRLREELGLADSFVIGHVGRFTYQKNHPFLIEIFSHIYQRNSKAKLLLIGEGELEQAIRDQTHRLGLDDAVIFYGVTEHTEKLYQVMDIFCFPSLYEGLPLVAVEAQSCGIPVIASDKVSKDIVISAKARFLSLKADMAEWVKAVCEFQPDQYDIEKLAKEMELFYEKHAS